MKAKSLILCLVAVLFTDCAPTITTHVLNGDLTVYNADGSILQEYKDITWKSYSYYTSEGLQTSSVGQPTKYEGMFSFTTNDGKGIVIANSPWKFEYYDLTVVAQAELSSIANGIRSEFMNKCNTIIKVPEGQQTICAVCGTSFTKRKTTNPYSMVTCSDECTKEIERIINPNSSNYYSDEDIIRIWGSKDGE